MKKNKLSKKNIHAILIVVFLATFWFCTGNVFAENKKSTTDSQKPKSLNEVIKETTPQKKETVIISIINYGRTNPFKPYTKVSLVSKDSTLLTEDIPFPPSHNPELRSEINELMSAQVNGILYDPHSKSSAIIKVKGKDYMVHAGDEVHGFKVKKITKSKVTLKYGSNSYSVGVGQVVDGSINHEPVIRKNKGFAGQNYPLPDIELEEL